MAPAADAAAHRRQAAAALDRFHRKARDRSQRWGRDEHGKRARYRRHVGALKHALAQPRAEWSGEQGAQLSELAGTIVEDW